MIQSLRRFFALPAIIAGFASIGAAQTSPIYSSGGGSVAADTYNDIIFNGNANYTVSGGVIVNDDLSVRDNALVSINGASIADKVSSTGDSFLTFNSGSADNGLVGANGNFTMNGGTITNSIFVTSGTLTMNGGSVKSIGGGTSSGGTFNFNGGTLTTGIDLSWDLDGIISGGTTVNVNINRNSNLTIRAYDFGTGYSSGDVITLADLGADPLGLVNTISGMTFSIDYGSGNTDTFTIRAHNHNTTSTWNGSITLMAVPEPATASLLLGVVAITAVVARRRTRVA